MEVEDGGNLEQQGTRIIFQGKMCVFLLRCPGMASSSGQEVSEIQTEGENRVKSSTRTSIEFEKDSPIIDEELRRLFQECKDFISKMEMEEKSRPEKKTGSKPEPKWNTVKNAIALAARLNLTQTKESKTTIETDSGENTQRIVADTYSLAIPKDFRHLNPDIAKKLASLKKEECLEFGGTIWDCQICLSLLILHLRLTHDIYHESPRCLLTQINEDI